jgi:hypothetical protein
MSRMERGRPRLQPDGYFYDDFYVCPPGTYGRGDSQEQRRPAEGWEERAEQALNNGDDSRFRRLVDRFNWFMR